MNAESIPDVGANPVIFILGIIVFCIGLFCAIVAVLAPFWIYGILQELRQVNERIGQLLAQPRGRGPSEEIQRALRDVHTVKQIMTGETTPEAEQERARVAEEARAMNDDIPINSMVPRKGPIQFPKKVS